MIKKYSIIFVLLFNVSAFSQLTDKESVTKQELQQNSYANDTTASAVILSKKASTYFRYKNKTGFDSFTEVALKIKILKSEGLVWANFEIPYFTGYKFLNDECVFIKKAFTYNFENGRITKDKVTGESKFTDKVNENWSVKKLTFPNVKVGSVIEINYEFRTENLSELPEFQFQYTIPVAKMEYTTKIPEFYIYKGIQTGYVEVVSEAVLENTSQSFEGEHGNTLSMNYKQIRTVYKAENIQALKEEKYVNSIKNYYGKIIHELEIIRMPEEEPKHIASTWDDIAKALYSEKNVGPQLEKFNYFLNDLKVLIKDVDSAQSKMTKVFQFVKNKMNWNGKYGYSVRDDVALAYDQRTGNVAEINYILIAMLKLSGLEANPVVLSSRDNGLALFPNKTFLNYVIASVELDGKKYLLDATDKFSGINQIPVRALNLYGRLIKKDGTATEIDLMPKANSKEAINGMVSLDSQGGITGKIRHLYNDYNALIFRENKGGLTEKSLVEQLERQYQGVEFSEYKVQDVRNLSQPVIECYSFSQPNAAEIIGDKIYVQPLLFFTVSENPFKQESRQYPIDFVYPYQTRYNIGLTIPQGYTVEMLPQSKAIAMPDNLGNFKYNIILNGNQIQLLCTIDINQATIPAEGYGALKNFYEEIISKQTEKIVLKKS
ncbi:hypothetical protein [Flavobacterium sp. XGLA_31]|uniref:hypothetical protein n=1 Tax=Flavobacterium sp. XGLA_31 TaxID=3447666 RepID=UPI003F2B34C6